MTTLTPQAHARLSPSSSKGWFACPGKMKMEEPFPESFNQYTDDGTAMHDVAAVCLMAGTDAASTIGKWVTVSHGTEALRKVQIDEEMADLVQGYLDYVRRKAAGHRLHVEQRVSFSRFIATENQFGTADATIEDLPADVLDCTDLKTGITPVDVEDNSQALIYLLGMLGQLYEQALLADDMTGMAVGTPELVDPREYRCRVFDWAHAQGLRTVKLAIYQPQVFDAPQEWTCTLDDLYAFAMLLHAKADRVRVAEAQHAHLPFEQWWPIYLNPDPNDVECAFCRAMATCPSQQAKLQSRAMVAFGPVAEGEVTIPDPKTYGPVELSQAMKIVPMFEDWLKAVRAEVERRLLAGDEVEGFGLELGRQGNRKFTDPEAAEKLLRRKFRLTQDDIFHYTLKNPTQIEKLFKPTKGPDGKMVPPIIGVKQWPQVVALVDRAPAKPSVKPRAQIRTPYVPPQLTAEGFEAVPEDDVDDMS